MPSKGRDRAMSAATAEPVLVSTGLSMAFGGFTALNSVDITVRRGQVFGLLGPNGSGKSTWINCVSGIYQPVAGRVSFCGQDVTGRQPHRMYHAGLGRTFQRLENFPEMSVMENMLLALQESQGRPVDAPVQALGGHRAGAS